MMTTIAGIRCEVEVLHIFVKKPDPGADNPDDFHGWREVEFNVCDKRGRPAPWLETLMTDAEKRRIEDEILENA